MKKIVSWLNDSTYVEPLSPGCKMCAEGSKLVVFSTGLCTAGCFYCPLSFEKGGKDRIFANEWELNDEDDIEKLIQEAKLIEATGAGITGGDPLFVWKRVVNYISLLKNSFGHNFHVHLYTSGLKNEDHIKDLVDAGLDEIRFHPSPKYWRSIENSPYATVIATVLDMDVDVAFQIPSIPGLEDDIFSLIQWSDRNEINWINLNELEFSERNVNSLKKRDFVPKDDISAAVYGSEESAIDILKNAANSDMNIGIHYCSASFKDGIQLTNRIKRRAKNVARDFEVISEEGTLIKGIITVKDSISLEYIYTSIQKEFDIPDRFIFLNKDKRRIEIGLWILEEIAQVLTKRGMNCFMIEEYPTADGLEVERTPLPF